MIDMLKEKINEIKIKIADLDKAVGNASTDLELNDIGAKVVALEDELKAFMEALLVAEELSQKLNAVKQKTFKV